MTIANPTLTDTHEVEELTGLRKWATYASVATALLLVSVKLVAFLFTDSVALLSSLVDSTIDAFASLVMLIGVHIASQPADKDHRFGHGKYESLASLAQAVFIFGSVIFLIFEALGHIASPRETQNSTIGIGVMIFSIIVTALLISFQYYVIRKTDSVAIAADSLHYKGDLLINLAVIAAFVLSDYFPWPYFDPLFALIIAMALLRGSWVIGVSSINILMDKELSNEDRERIVEIVSEVKEICGIHDLRTRTTGIHIFIEFHLEIEGNLTVNTAHKITEKVESKIYEAFPNAEVIIHQEPCGIEDDRLDDRLHENS